ncbi:MazG nucleotide pyrophosphohydrolase domain-containing protein [Marinobacter sp.]|uniref:MazG nucleotide pyrophosphohydrolase domain-containing protein n=1 Tax=Marinobacter sp. TaxID=50741 RepID=UPI00261969A5|nr:MazG nucleotide pyrophosphohydrolase domain-containing protein [Marinobacter sp.]
MTEDRTQLQKGLETIRQHKASLKGPETIEPRAFNGLTNAEAERLAVLAEELGEVQQVIGKIQRFGFDTGHPESGRNNRQDLEKELGDVRNAERMMIEAGDVNPAEIQLRAKAKAMTIGQYLHHQLAQEEGND